MVKTGYAMILARLRQATQPGPSRKENRARLSKLHEFIARGLLPNKFPINSKKTWRGSFDPTGQDEGLSADNPKLGSLEVFVGQLQDKVQPQLSLQLRIMLLEARIYLAMRKLYEISVDEKYPPTIKDKYRKWAGTTSTHQGTPTEEVEVDSLAGSWANYDQQPDLLVIKPELRRVPHPHESRHRYPDLLRKWWSAGLVEASLIDTHGTCTRCQVWQLNSHLGNHRCHQKHLQVETWALETERLKVELLIESSYEKTDMLRKELLEACGVSNLKKVIPSNARPDHGPRLSQSQVAWYVTKRHLAQT